MNRQILVVTGSFVVVTVLFVLSYITFSVFDITSSNTRRYELTIVTENAEKLYDETELRHDAWFIESGKLEEGHSIQVIMPSKITEPGTVNNEIGVTILDEDGYMITESYSITLELGTLTVHPRELTIKTLSESKVYDGETLRLDEWYFKQGALMSGHRIEYTMPAHITDPGAIDNTIDFTIFNQNNDDVTNRYDITMDIGTLTVHHIDMTVRTASDERIYNGTPLSAEEWYIQHGSLLSGHHLDYVMASKITTPGTIDNEITLSIYNNEGKDVTHVYNIDHNLGTLSVHPREIVFHTESAEKVYDGTPLTAGGWLIQKGTLASGHRIEYTMPSRITSPGSIDNLLDITILDAADDDVTANYLIDYQLGSLTVYHRKITVRTANEDKVYDGTPLESDNWVLHQGTLASGHRIEHTMTASIIEPGRVNNTIGITVLDENDNDVKDNYDVSYDLGRLRVHHRELTIETESDEKTFDGLALSRNEWRIKHGILLDGHHINYTMPASITKPGTIDNTIDITIRDENNNDVTPHYAVSFDIGVLRVHAVALTIRTESEEKTYDAIELRLPSWQIQNGALLSGHRIEYVMPARITSPGTVDNDIDVTILDLNDNVVTDVYDITYNIGSLTVYPREVTIRTESASKTYDGTPLTHPTWYIQSGNLLSGHRFEYTMPSSITTPGTINNDIGITILDDNDNDVTKNYELDVILGSLTVDPRTLTIETGSASKAYNGTPLTSNEWQLRNGTLASGHRIEHAMPSSIITPGSKDNDIDITVFDENDNDVTANYAFNIDWGTLTVHPREITIRTENASKTYDGNPLTSDQWTLFQGTLLSGHRIEKVMPSSITKPGVINNEIGITIFDANDQDITHRYNITYAMGTLTVDPIPLIVRSIGAQKVYDGTPLTNDAWELVNGTLLADHELFAIVEGEITNVGKIENNIFAYVLNEHGDNVSSYYDITYFKGFLEVTSSIYSSNDLMTTPPDELPDHNVFRYYTSQSEPVYFRAESMGNYNKSGWDAPVVYTGAQHANPLNYAAIALEESGKMDSVLELEYLMDEQRFLVPYFTVDRFSGSNDISVSGDRSGILSFSYITYAYNDGDAYTPQSAHYSDDELAYRTFVYNHYLHVPTSTYQEMLQIADENNLDPSSPTFISDVQTYIQNAASYSLNFEPFPAGVDMAIHFLTVSKEGICQHYATAATLMYRSLGIPARYVTGYLGVGEANQWNTVTGEYAHAWVEVYIDGMGWVPVEVTGGGPGVGEPVDGGGSGGPGGSNGDGDGDNGDGNGDGDNGDGDNGDGNGDGDNGDGDPVELIDINARPQAVRKSYQPGKVITATEVNLFGFSPYAALGYTYDVTFTGDLSTPGIGSSHIDTLTIYDDQGNDVTHLFDINKLSGVLQLYLHEVQLVTSGDQRAYDGTPLTNDGWNIVGDLGVGHVVHNVNFTGSQTNVGVSRNTVQITIHDEHGEDVTDVYRITNSFGDLVVVPRYIMVVSNSAEKAFDGTSLTDDGYQLLIGTLAPGDTIEISITGSQTGVGQSMNTIESITITNNGTVVTNNYIIDTIEGELTVTPD